MFNKKLIKLLAYVLSASCLLATTSSLTVSADETIGSSNTNAQVFVLNEDDNGQPPIYYGDDGIMPYGKNPPSTSNVYNLSNNSYHGNIESLYTAVYTESWLTGASTIKIVVQGGMDMRQWLEDYGHLGKNVKITLYDSSHNEVASNSSTNPNAIVALGVGGLNSSSRYYVKVSKTNDTVQLKGISLTIVKME